MEVQETGAVVRFSAETATVQFVGLLRLPHLKAYDNIARLLHAAAGQVGDTLTLDFRELRFLNSSGLSALGMFVVAIRKAGRPKLRMLGAKSNAWQQNSLRNFQILWNETVLLIE